MIMNKTTLTYIYFLMIVLLPNVLNAQQRTLNIANKQFNEKQYINAQETYLKVLKMDYKTPEIFKKLGDSYYFNNELDKAAEWYEKLIENHSEEATNEYLLRYAQCLRALEEYDKSNQYMNRYYQNSQYTDYSSLTPEDYLKRIEYQSGRYDIENQTINSPFSDFGSAKYNDLIVFSSSRDTLLVRKRIHKWTNESFLSMYQAKIDEETGNLFDVEPFAQELNTKFHESTPVFNDDGNVVYFTKNKIGSNRKELDVLGIYRSFKDEKGNWMPAEELSINEKEYSVGHPALSPDGYTLYFSSDKPGGYGDSDIYAVTIRNDGNLDIPYNLGPKINTPGKDTFPFISSSGEFYFSSNGHFGLGGLDVFFSDLENESLEVINVGRPVNSKKDDFGFFINGNSRDGYFSSNREGGKGKDDIYRIYESMRIKSLTINVIVGTILDKDTKEYIDSTTVKVYDRNNNLIDEQLVEDGSQYRFFSNELKNAYRIEALKDGYQFYEHIIIQTVFRDKYKNNIELEKVVNPEPYSNFENNLSVKNNFPDSKDMYEFQLIADSSHFIENTSTIKSSSEKTLATISKLLEKYPSVFVNIESYLEDTNQRQPFLAKERAKAIKEFLLNQGVENHRLMASGVPKGSVKMEEKLQLIMVVPLPINFDFNVSDLRQDAVVGLDKVIDLMTEYPKMKMEVHGHTDSRSSFWYNKKLSVERMRSAEAYITERGNINWRRLRGKAYGERKLFNECGDGVPCTEEKHEQNRRCEFIIKE